MQPPATTQDPVTATNDPPKAAGFNFGGKCEGGSGSFGQAIKKDGTVDVPGTIPVGKMNVVVKLTSNKDVDVQLVDKATGVEIVAWPSGLLSGAGRATVLYNGVRYEYSGYNGDGTGAGNEYIKVLGITNRELVMRAFGYAAGSAAITYTWEAPTGCVDQGQGDFSSDIRDKQTSDVGVIPAGKKSVAIRLTSPRDVDVQVFDKATGDPIVAWGEAGTLIATAGEKCATYKGNTYCYSGYNGVGGKKGHEWISISGVTQRDVIMRAYGFAAGAALVEYSWGQAGYCAGSAPCRGLSKALPFDTPIDGGACSSAAPACAWVTAKPYN